MLASQINLCNQIRNGLKSLLNGKQSWWCSMLIPVHVINEYCHPNRPFDPCPDFTQSSALPRTRKIEEGEWFACYNGGALGETLVCIGGPFPSARHLACHAERAGGAVVDYKACYTLFSKSDCCSVKH